MKPWEEEWRVRNSIGGEDCVYSETSREYVLETYTAVGTPGYERYAECARLAAAAPEMARLLLEKQWGDRGWCLWCDGIDPADTTCRGEGHAADCALVAVLRKAGVRG
jgi:hypothetical protein